MKTLITLLLILGLAGATLADPQTGGPSAPTYGTLFPQLVSPAGSALMTNAEFLIFSGNHLFFRNADGYQSFPAADLNTDVLAALHLTTAPPEARQTNLAPAAQRPREAAAAALFGHPQIGRPAPPFTARDIFGQTVSLGDYQGKIVVLESYYNGCPFCENHYTSGALPELQRELTTNGVVWLLIDCAAGDRQTPAMARQDWLNKKMAVTGWITDAGFQIARAYAMRTAPEAFVIDTNGVLAYQGAMDNLPQLYPGNEMLTADPRPARNYVREAVRALLAGQPVAVPETKPYGCALIYNGMPDRQLFTPPAYLPR